MHCTKCGGINVDEAQFCVKCGAPLNHCDSVEEQQNTSKAGQDRNNSGKRKKRSMVLWAAGLSALLVIAAVILIIWLPGSGENEAQKDKPPLPEEVLSFGKDKGAEDTITVTEKEEALEADGSAAATESTIDWGTEDGVSTATVESATEPAIIQEEIVEEAHSYGDEVILTEVEKALLAALVKAAYSSGNYDASVATDYSKMSFLWDMTYRSDVTVIPTEEIDGEYGYVSGAYLSQILTWGLGQQLDLNRLKEYEDLMVGFEHTFQEGYILLAAADGERYPQLVVDSIIHTEDNQICVSGKGYVSDIYGDHDIVKLKAYLTREPDSIFAGYRLLYIEEDSVSTLLPDTISASSSLVESNVSDYTPENLMDNDLTTAWVEGARGFGIGESITFAWEEEQTILGIAITNGYCKSEDTYYNNGRTIDFKLEFSDGSEKYLYIENDMIPIGGEAEFYFTDRIIKTDSIKLTIMSVVEGNKYEDTCISEVRFLQ